MPDFVERVRMSVISYKEATHAQ